jgi:tRNA (guanine37-N1)-methyltransferase
MKYRIFTLYPQIFDSFLDTSLIARAKAKGVLEFELVNWRQEFGTRGHKQIDDKPYGGGSGMVLQVEPIFNALSKYNSLSPLFTNPEYSIYPNNKKFYDLCQKDKNVKKVSILLGPRGYPVTQKTCEWLAQNFEELNILCGRFEGFDYRVNAMVDLELSIGDFVINGGEVASMALVEGVSRLIPGFITKETSVLHDSFSSSLNHYRESEAFVNFSKKEKKELEQGNLNPNNKISELFDESWWLSRITLYEHPQYTRPESFLGLNVPKVIIEGNHKEVVKWRLQWFKKETNLSKDDQVIKGEITN